MRTSSSPGGVGVNQSVVQPLELQQTLNYAHFYNLALNMRTAILTIALAGAVAAEPAAAPAPTAAASLDARATACDIDYDLGRPLQPPAPLKPWLRTAPPPDACTAVMPARLTSAWLAYLGQLSSFVAHAPDKTAALTDLCGSATYTVSVELCASQGKIVVTAEDGGAVVTTVANTVRDPGAVVLTSKDGRIGVAASATMTSEEDGKSTTVRTAESSSSVVRTSSRGSTRTTGAATTSGGASKTSAAVSSTATDKPKTNAADRIGAGFAAVAAGVAVLAL